MTKAIPTQTESPATPLTIQQRLNLARRLLRDYDARLAISMRECNAALERRDALLVKRQEIEAEIEAAALCYRDARDAGRLAEQGAGAVALVEEWLGL